jgi:hypothetical protein
VVFEHRDARGVESVTYVAGPYPPTPTKVLPMCPVRTLSTSVALLLATRSDYAPVHPALASGFLVSALLLTLPTEHFREERGQFGQLWLTHNMRVVALRIRPPVKVDVLVRIL